MILVIGGAGYIGSHMTALLRESDESHLVLDNLERGHAGALLSSSFVNADLRDQGAVENVFASHPEIDVVMHFAAYTYVGESVDEPERYWQNNTVAVLNLLETMKRHGVNKFVFSSTCATYGEPLYLPLDEAHPQRPISPYGKTKLAVEQILEDFDQAYGIKSAVLRYFNAAGAYPDGHIGEDHRPEAHLIPNAIFAATGQKPPLTVFGDDYDTPDGTCIRDYIHVCDLAAAHALAIRHLRSDGNSVAFNLGNGNGYSVREVIDVVSQVVGTQVPYSLGPRRPGDPARLVGSSSAIRQAWNWEPQSPQLEKIVGDAWNWHRNHPNGFGSTV
jgi:UDP-glucose 4-epimerase